MAERVFIALGQKPRFLMLPSNFLQTGFRAISQRMNEDLVFDVAEGLKILDYQPRPFKPEFPGYAAASVNPFSGDHGASRALVAALTV
jgi:hypothetical protein